VFKYQESEGKFRPSAYGKFLSVFFLKKKKNSRRQQTKKAYLLNKNKNCFFLKKTLVS
jgi:hypothetical protein